MADVFESARLKLKRANNHIDDLERQFATFVEANPHTVRIETNPDDKRLAVRIRFGKEPPTDLALTIGDAVHNLRTALDHMTWELIGIDKGTQDRYLKLPTGDNRTNFEASCNGIKTPTQAVKDTLKSLEVFPAGKGDILYSLHLLDNSEKHTTLIPVVRATRLSSLVVLNPNGSTMMTMTNCTFAGGSGPFANIASLPPSASVKLDQYCKATPDIFFRKVEGAPAEPTIPALRKFSDATSNAIDTVAKSLP